MRCHFPRPEVDPLTPILAACAGSIAGLVCMPHYKSLLLAKQQGWAIGVIGLALVSACSLACSLASIFAMQVLSFFSLFFSCFAFADLLFFFSCFALAGLDSCSGIVLT